MNLKYIYRPVLFFALTFLVTWASWFIAAYFSHQDNKEGLMVGLLLLGLIAPSLIAFIMIAGSKNDELKKHNREKLFNIKLIRPEYIPFMLIVMPAVMVVSILISLLFGLSAEQFRFADKFSFSAAFVPVLLVLFLAAMFEELGWRSYALDSLRSRFNLFNATLIFSALWALWHLPLFFIEHYYQNELLRENIFYALNFMIGVIPMGFIITWLCQKNGSSIIAAIVFHFMINIWQEALLVTQFTKCIETFVLFVIAIILVVIDKDMFFRGKVEVSGDS